MQVQKSGSQSVSTRAANKKAREAKFHKDYADLSAALMSVRKKPTKHKTSALTFPVPKEAAKHDASAEASRYTDMCKYVRSHIKAIAREMLARNNNDYSKKDRYYSHAVSMLEGFTNPIPLVDSVARSICLELVAKGKA